MAPDGTSLWCRAAVVCPQHLAAMPVIKILCFVWPAVIIAKVCRRVMVVIGDDCIGIFLCLHSLQPGQEGPTVGFELVLVNRKDPTRSVGKGKPEPSVLTHCLEHLQGMNGQPHTPVDRQKVRLHSLRTCCMFYGVLDR